MLVLNGLLNRVPAASDLELTAYAQVVEPMLDRAEHLYQQWIEQAAMFVESERLANAAAVQRWDLATMKQMAEGAIPPRGLARAHADFVASLHVASRAAQLLNSGHRFHTASAVCDGTTLLEEARQQRQSAEREIRRLLHRSGADTDRQVAAGPSAESNPTT